MIMMGAMSSRLQSDVFLGTQEPEVIDTRFGKIQVQRQNPIIFPRGLLGMPDKFNFFLTEFPNERMHRFKLFQSLEDYNLSFITLPLDIQNDIYSIDDLTSACKELDISLKTMAILLVVSVHRSPAKVSLSVNARAPLLVDSTTRLAAQYVFHTDKYSVQHAITA